MTNPIETPPGIIPSGMVERVKAILLKPKEEWPVIATEPASISSLYLRYAVILAAIPAVASFIHSAVFGYGALGFHYRPSLAASLGMGISQYVMSLISVAVIALVADFIVTHFGGTSDRLSAFKLAVYASTAAWVAGVFNLVPGLGFLSILGLYSIYLLYTGLPVLMKVPQDKAGVCTAAIAVLAIIVMIVAGALIGPVSGMFGGRAPLADMGGAGTVTVPGGGTLDMGKLAEAGKRMEAATADGGTKAVDAAKLKALLPTSIGGFTRGDSESASMGAVGMGGSQASATYTKGEQSLKVELTDMAAVGALAGIGAALGVTSEKETATGFERTRSEDGRMVTEKWDNASKNGSYTTTIANRFMLSVEGDADSFDDLKAVASAIDPAQVAALAQ